MRFVSWYPLAEAGEHAPPTPGVFQIRVRAGLVDYPRGKSAMIYYGWGREVRAAATAFLAAHPGADWLCRHAVQMSEWELDHPAAVAGQFVERFEARFGSPPRVPR